MSKQYVIYVAGPFRDNSQWGQTQNIRRAEEAALQVWRAGHVAICPHLNTAHFQDELPDKVWLKGDLEILKRCDGVLMVRNWLHSTGTRKEVQLAKDLGLPHSDFLDDLLTALNEKETNQ